MRSLEFRSGNRASVLGIPDRKEWHEMVLTPGVQISESRWDSVMLNCVIVKFFPLPKRKTGSEGAKTPASICFAFRFLRARTGQQP